MQNLNLISVIDELNQYSNGNVTRESLIETLSNLTYKLKNQDNSKELDYIKEYELDSMATEIYGEFGFNTCTLQEQKELLTKFINKELCN